MCTKYCTAGHADIVMAQAKQTVGAVTFCGRF